MEELIAKAAGMIEALPFIQRFRNETVVVKFGGSILDDEAACAGILQDVSFMEVVGLRPVLVHGGGKAISRRMAELNLEPNFLQGLRVTDAETMEVVENSLNREVNANLVKQLRSMGCRSMGIYGQTILTASRRTGTDPDSGETLDWGYVGEVTCVDTAPILECTSGQTVPVITPLGRGADGHTYNINADEAAAAIAAGLPARKLVYLSDVPGLLRDPGDSSTLISHVSSGDVEQLVRDGVIGGGMIPKIRSAVQTLEAGVNKVHIVDAGMRHSLLLELFTEKGVGTEIVKS
jgi:acetylglutamate kinase